jgi:peptidoglycan hydrolase-like protein with peptidoglycan-binding domain
MPQNTVGIRNKNYLNVKNNPADPWQGSIGTDPHGHTVFSAPEYGLRAAVMTMRSYWFKYGLNTVAEILSRWAPADDTIGSIPGAPKNSPKEYTGFVCGRIRVGPNEDLALFHPDKRLNNLTNLQGLVEAMAEFENYVGFDVPDTEFEKALFLVEPDHTTSPQGTAVAFSPSAEDVSPGTVRVGAAEDLDEIRAKNLSIPIVDLGLPEHRTLATEIQQRLIVLGFLEPPADGRFGPLSRHALEEFQNCAGQAKHTGLDGLLAQALVVSGEDRFFPVILDSSLASQILKYMRLNDLWYARAPGQVNIVYIEGANEDGTPNEDRPNEFNDRRMVLAIQDQRPKIVGNWEGTTEPGRYWTETPMNPRGAARIAFGQYKAWCVGFHHRDKPKLSHEALVQVGIIKVHRDLNKDYKRVGDFVEEGDSFAVNQHWGYDNPKDNLGQSSAGCLVGRTKDGHREFMALLKADPRYESNHGYRFMTTVIAGDKFAAEVKDFKPPTPMKNVATQELTLGKRMHRRPFTRKKKRTARGAGFAHV